MEGGTLYLKEVAETMMKLLLRDVRSLDLLCIRHWDLPIKLDNSTTFATAAIKFTHQRKGAYIE